MQINKDTIGRLEGFRAQAQSKIKDLQAQLLTYITVNQKLDVVVDPAKKDDAGKVLRNIAVFQSHIQEYDELIASIHEAAIALNLESCEFQGQISRLEGKILQAEHTLTKGIASGVLTRSQSEELESTTADCKKKIKAIEKVISPIQAKLNPLSDTIGLAAMMA